MRLPILFILWPEQKGVEGASDFQRIIKKEGPVPQPAADAPGSLVDQRLSSETSADDSESYSEIEGIYSEESSRFQLFPARVAAFPFIGVFFTLLFFFIRGNAGGGLKESFSGMHCWWPASVDPVATVLGTGAFTMALVIATAAFNSTEEYSLELDRSRISDRIRLAKLTSLSRVASFATSLLLAACLTCLLPEGDTRMRLAGGLAFGMSLLFSGLALTMPKFENPFSQLAEIEDLLNKIEAHRRKLRTFPFSKENALGGGRCYRLSHSPYSYSAIAIIFLTFLFAMCSWLVSEGEDVPGFFAVCGAGNLLVGIAVIYVRHMYPTPVMEEKSDAVVFTTMVALMSVLWLGLMLSIPVSAKPDVSRLGFWPAIMSTMSIIAALCFASPRFGSNIIRFRVLNRREHIAEEGEYSIQKKFGIPRNN